MLERTISNYGIFYLRKFGDPILMTGTELVVDDEFDSFSLNAIVNSMTKFLHPGAIGLAANQVGIQKEIFVWAIDKEPRTIINPSILEFASQSYVSKEGCLSFPGLQFDILRHKNITIEYQDIHGERKTYKTKTELESSLFQHEIDHLAGIVPINNRNLLEYRRI